MNFSNASLPISVKRMYFANSSKKEIELKKAKEEM
jgi:hypothetical protein